HSSQSGHLHWSVAVCGAVVSELTVAVEAPGPNGAVRLKRETVVGAAGNCDDAAQACGLDRGAGLRDAVVAELTVYVVPPTPDRAVALDGETVVDTGGQSCTSWSRTSGRCEPIR